MHKNKLVRKFFSLFLLLFILAPVTQAAASQQKVLATTFPIYQIVRNVTNGQDSVQVELMLPGQMGCPHDYALTPQDMQKLAQADILVINGLGMEEFLGAPIEKANPNLSIIDSSSTVKETLEYICTEDHDHEGEEEEHEHHAHHEHEHEADIHKQEGHEHHEHEHEADSAEGHEHHHHAHCHHHHGTNPHLFASPRMVAQIAMNIAAQLSALDPAGADLYTQNAKAYAEKMNTLADEMAALGSRLKNNRIVEPHGVFDYLARDMHLDIVAVMLPHGQEPSAYGLRHLAETIKEKQAGGIFTEPQYPAKVGNLLTKETGLPLATLDPVATGPDNAPLDYYETIMRQNMKTLEQTLGKK